jgi:hypothetical protein
MNSPFTYPDTRIESPNFRDPLGFQAVWSYFGQQVFRNRFTTISNDIRNFSINLYHHFIIRDLLASFKNTNREAEVRDMRFVQGIFMVLENLYLLVVNELPDGENGFDHVGLLGAAKARALCAERMNRSMQSGSYPLALHAQAGVLNRQASLGLSGRYNGAFRSMGLMDVTPSNQFIQNLPDLDGPAFVSWKKHIPILVDVIRPILSAPGRRLADVDRFLYPDLREEAPMMTFDQLVGNKERDIAESYISLFSSQLKITGNDDLKWFWIERLGFDDELRKGLYKRVLATHDQSDPDWAEIFSASAADPLIQDIIHAEELMIRSQYLFDCLRLSGVGSYDAWAGELTLRGYYPIREPSLDYFKSRAIHSTIVSERIRSLNHIATMEISLELYKAIIDYHRDIMHTRNLRPWVEEQSDRIANISGTIRPDRLLAFDASNWIHDFYLSTVRSFQIGLEGIAP